MTREEAMDIFEHNWTRLVNPDYTEEELNKAIGMAIEALEQEPCDDCCNGNQIEKAKLCQKSYIAGMEHKQEPKWIPCTERMPEKSGFYLVSGRGKVWIYEMLDIMGLKGWCGELGRPIVKAWMPLPEPYEPQERSDRDA